MRARGAIGVVDAAYSLEGDDNAWLKRVLEAASRDVEAGRGSYAFTCRVGESDLEVGPAYVEQQLDPRWSEQVAELNRTVPGIFFKPIKSSAIHCGGFMDWAQHVPVMSAHFQSRARRAGLLDGFALFAQDGEGHAFSLSAPTAHRLHVHSRVVGVWRRVGIHVAAAMRLRRHAKSLRAPPEALLSPGGTIADARGAVRSNRVARELLSHAVKDVERARSDRVRRNPDDALELWRGLVGGAWSLVDHWERDGRRYVAAYRNLPQVPDPRALTEHERVVLRYLGLGGSIKEIAFTLGVSDGSVRDAVSHMMRKLRCRRRGDLLAWADPVHAERVTVPVGTDAVEVLSVPYAAGGPLAVGLSQAEQEIAAHLVHGSTNAQIARARGTSPRTVANQIKHMFERLSVGSRTELVYALTKANARGHV